ncbi:MAG: cytochrome c-type biogenesis CcmF C-terminal domain-containing protein, partial [Alphaproteobacteria bacterium]
PIMAPLFAIMAIGPFLAWKRADLAGVLGRLKFAFAAAVLAALGAVALEGGPILAVLAMALAAWLFVGTWAEWADRIKLFRVPLSDSLRRARGLPRSAHGMTLAHAGLAIAIVGMTAAASWNLELVQTMRLGESVDLAGYTYRLDRVDQVQGPNYTSDMAHITVSRDGRVIAQLTPEKRLYPVQQMPTTEAGIHTTGLADLYVVIGDPVDSGGWTMRIFHEPMVPWIWAGALLMILGGVVSLSDRRLRLGAPARRAKKTPASGAPARA